MYKIKNKKQEKKKKRNGGGGNYREFKDKHAGTLIITRTRQCEYVPGMNKYKMQRRFCKLNSKKKHQM